MSSSLAEHDKRESKKKQLFIYAMARRDVEISLSKLNEILVTTNYNNKEANTIALYVTYARIFGKNLELPKLNINDINADLTEDEKTIHNAIINGRNKTYAHSDASINQIQIHRNTHGKLVATPSYHASLIENHSEIAISLFNKIRDATEIKINELLVDLYNQNDGYKLKDGRFAVLGYRNEFFEKLLESK